MHYESTRWAATGGLATQRQGSAARAFMQTGDDEFESAGGIAGRWLNVAPGASLDSHQVPSRRGGAAANMSACGGGSGGGAVARGVAAVVGMSASGVGDGALAVALDALTLDELDSLAAAVQDARRRRPASASTSASSRSCAQAQQAPARQPRATTAAAATKAGTPRGGRAAVGADGDDDLDGGSIAGRWLKVPPGGTLPSSSAASSSSPSPSPQPTGTPRGTGSARSRATVGAAAPKKVLGRNDDLD